MNQKNDRIRQIESYPDEEKELLRKEFERVLEKPDKLKDTDTDPKIVLLKEE